MTAIVQRAKAAARTPAIRSARLWALRQRDEHDSVPVRQARNLVRRLRTSPPDVVYLGDSTSSWVHPDDGDQRTLATMIADALGPDLSVVSVHGAGYNMLLHAAYLRLLTATPHRPLVVHSIWDRGVAFPWARHPVHAHAHTIEAIDRLDPTGPLWRMRARRVEPVATDFDAFYAIPYETMNVTGTIGDLARPLRDRDRWALDDPERMQLLYEYHYGARFTPATSDLDRVRNLGRLLAELGCRSVAYENPVPSELSRRLLGDEVTEIIDSNLDLVHDAYQEGRGGAPVVRLANRFAESDFIDLTDAAEHVRDVPRLRIADAVAASVREVLGRPDPGNGR